MASCSENKFCDICRKTDDDSVELGDFMEKSGVKVHYYCLLLSTNLHQAGKDTGGILGFLIKDIKKFLKGIQYEICYYCNEPSASIHCKDCSKKFHLVCGLQNNCQFQFADTFSSYCHEHHKIKHPKKHTPQEGCFICFTTIGEYNPLTSVMAKCCSCGWVHRKCLKKYALAGGYYLKCIWCRNEQFRNEIRLEGIFVPDRDANWENDKGTYSDLYRGHSTCDALTCICPKGRSHVDRKGKWTLRVCSACRAYGEHIECDKSKTVDFLCFVCKGVLYKTGGARASSTFSTVNNSRLDISLYITKTQSTDLQSTIDDSCVLNQSFEEVEEEEEKDIFIVVDETTNSIVGSLEAKRKDSFNEDNLRMEDLEFEKDDFYPILGGSREKGCQIIDEIIEKVVQEIVIAPKFHIELSDSEDE